MHSYKRHILKNIPIILFVCSIAYLLLYMKPSLTDFDENYTLSLIKHNYKDIIYLNSFDVHPPLYYFLLKIFLEITTFWTPYLPIKIIFARLFSIIISIISFLYLRQITEALKVKNNVCIQWASFVALPLTLGIKFPFQQMVNIRMYALAGLFVIMMFYYLLKFKISHNNFYLFVITFCAVCAVYTHYYAAIFSGLLLLFYFCQYVFKKDYLDSIKMFFVGILVILSFIPWIPIFIKQINDPFTYWMSATTEIKEIAIFLFILGIFILPIIRYIKHINNELFVEQFNLIASLIAIVFIFSLIYTIFKGPIFQYRYMYPVLIIYEFLGINILLKYFTNYSKAVVFLLILIAIISSCVQLRSDKYSINSIRTYNSWETRQCILVTKGAHISNENNIVNDSLYVSYMNKKFIITKSAYKSFRRNSNIYKKMYRHLYRNDMKKIKID